MVEKRVTRQIEEIISGPTKEPDPDALPYEEEIIYEDKTHKNNN